LNAEVAIPTAVIGSIIYSKPHRTYIIRIYTINPIIISEAFRPAVIVAGFIEPASVTVYPHVSVCYEHEDAHQNSPANLCGLAMGLNRLLTKPPSAYLLRPALSKAMATACFCGLPAAISVFMF
jgi:hypothetical protein